MYCTNCGALNREGYAFCTNCGAPLLQQSPSQQVAARPGQQAPHAGAVPQPRPAQVAQPRQAQPQARPVPQPRPAQAAQPQARPPTHLGTLQRHALSHHGVSGGGGQGLGVERAN